MSASPPGNEPDLRIGREIRDLRKARGLTLTDMASRSGFSVGFLSQIETGRSSPSVKVLHSLAGILGVNISWFFLEREGQEEALRDLVVRAGARRQIRFDNGITDELLSPNLRRKIELLEAHLPAGSSSGEEPYNHEGEEAGLVIKGTLDLWVGDKFLKLQAGDSFAFESNLPHRYANPTTEETVIIWAVTPPSY